MNKTKTTFFCQNCGAQSSKWIGKCPHCNEWNTYAEEIVQKENKQNSWDKNNLQRNTKPKLLADIKANDEVRINSNNKELNRVLGGGIVPGSLVLIGGEPGIGKSTLMLQIALNLKNLKTVYVTGEESDQQIKMRAERLGTINTNLYICTETNIQNIFQYIAEIKPNILIIDSIQTVDTSHIESAPGSISQVRECAAELNKFAKQSSTSVFLIGHITKDGYIAGPKVLEHIVDTVLQFEGDQHHGYRILRTTKNRFGSTYELGIFEMHSKGLIEVSNPSDILLSKSDESFSGVTISATIEGTRPILIESQALVCNSAYGNPQRSSTGFDLRRLNMFLGVLEKKLGFRLGMKDVFLNITGGIKVEDPAIDLGVVCAIISSYQDIPVNQKMCFAAEIGLTGEIRPVNRIEQRISEADKLGFETIYISRYYKNEFDKSKFKIAIKPMSKLENLIALLF